MILRKPVEIVPRLCAGVKVGGAWVSIEYSPLPGDESRTRYRCHVDGVENDYTDDTLQSGCQGGKLQAGLSTFLNLLSTCGESWFRGGEHANMYPRRIAEWAYLYSDELSSLAMELEYVPGYLIQEED